MYENEEYDVIDLRELLQVLKNHIKWLIAVPIIFAIVSAVVSIYFISPVYQATTTIIVRQNNKSDDELSISDVNLGRGLLYTYAEMAKSVTVIDNTKKVLELESLDNKSITVSPVKDTQILKVTVQNTDKQLAMNIADTLVEEFTKEVIRITKTDNVAVVDYAKLPVNPIKPNKVMNILIAGILGEMIVVFVVFLKEYMDKTIKSEKDIEKYIGIPVIGIVPNFAQGGKGYGEIRSKKQSRVAHGGGLQENCN